MRKVITVYLSFLSCCALVACAPQPPTYRPSPFESAIGGGVLGAAGGAIVGATVPHVSVGRGAAIGALVGAPLALAVDSATIDPYDQSIQDSEETVRKNEEIIRRNERELESIRAQLKRERVVDIDEGLRAYQFVGPSQAMSIDRKRKCRPLRHRAKSL